jgi:hypothetical protein
MLNPIATSLALICILVMLLIVIRKLDRLQSTQNKIEESLNKLPGNSSGKTAAIENGKLDNLAKMIQNNQDQLSSLQKSMEDRLGEIGFQQAALPSQSPTTRAADTREIPNYKKNLERYLHLNFPSKDSEIMRNITALPNSIGEQSALKTRVIEINMDTDFSSMSEAKKDDFCQYVSDFLSRHGMVIFSPKLGQPLNEDTMSVKKQLSSSQKVSKILYFGIRHNDAVILKADVHVG